MDGAKVIMQQMAIDGGFQLAFMEPSCVWKF
jgi:hypothetical protein